MANQTPNNQTSSSTDTEQEATEEIEAVVDRGDDVLAIHSIAEMTHLSEAIVRRFLYRGIITSTKRRDVEAYCEHKTSQNVVARQPRITHKRTFNKWRK